MRLETIDLSNKLNEELHEDYRRLQKTQIKLLSQRVPESFLQKFDSEETALKELLDVVYGTMECEEDYEDS